MNKTYSPDLPSLTCPSSASTYAAAKACSSVTRESMNNNESITSNCFTSLQFKTIVIGELGDKEPRLHYQILYFQNVIWVHGTHIHVTESMPIQKLWPSLC